MFGFVVFFFFSSRRRHTRCYRDWSSDVCSSDLSSPPRCSPEVRTGSWVASTPASSAVATSSSTRKPPAAPSGRSEERRVGKECRARWEPYHDKKKEQESVREHWVQAV